MPPTLDAALAVLVVAFLMAGALALRAAAGAALILAILGCAAAEACRRRTLPPRGTARTGRARPVRA